MIHTLSEQPTFTHVVLTANCPVPPAAAEKKMFELFDFSINMQYTVEIPKNLWFEIQEI